MKVTVWTLAKAGSHGELVVTAHTSKADARKMLEHALKADGITHLGELDESLADAQLSELQQAWEIHFGGGCLIEQHEVDVPLVELDKAIAELKEMVHRRPAPREMTAKDAPPWMSADEANAWANGANAMREVMLPAKAVA
jgi:hypothetical protein